MFSSVLDCVCVLVGTGGDLTSSNLLISASQGLGLQACTTMSSSAHRCIQQSDVKICVTKSCCVNFILAEYSVSSEFKADELTNSIC